MHQREINIISIALQEMPNRETEERMKIFSHLHVEAKQAGIRVRQVDRVGVVDKLVLVQHVQVHARVHALCVCVSEV
jgi:hypothetical protein